MQFSQLRIGDTGFTVIIFYKKYCHVFTNDINNTCWIKFIQINTMFFYQPQQRLQRFFALFLRLVRIDRAGFDQLAGRIDHCQLAASALARIDAKNSQTAAWYESYGALPLLDAPQSLVLPLATIGTALTAAARR